MWTLPRLRLPRSPRSNEQAQPTDTDLRHLHRRDARVRAAGLVILIYLNNGLLN
jgi:hypothetical protein